MLGWIWPLVFLGRAQRKLLSRGLPILSYHKIGPAPAGTRDPFLYTSADHFGGHLRRLKQAGCAPGSLSDQFAAPAGSKTAAITFDDGFCNVIESGLAVLAEHGVHATQFIVAGRLGGRNEWDVEKGDLPEPLMDAGQVRQWLAAGHEIGSHSLTHRNLKKLAPAEAREEIQGSKKSLEDLFGVPVRHFCYPFGGYTPALGDLVREAGYTSACTVEFGVNAPGADPFALRRIIPLSGAELLRKAIHRLSTKAQLPR